MKFKGWSYPLDNSPDLTKSIYTTLSTSGLFKRPELLLNENKLAATMGSEDFHHLVIHNKKKNYAYLNIGIADPQRFAEAAKTNSYPFFPHNGNYQVDLAAIPFGIKVGISSLLSIFQHKP